MAAEFHLMYRTYDGEWHEFNTLSGQQIVFDTVYDAEAIIQHLVSMDGVSEGVVMDEDDKVVQEWKTAPSNSAIQVSFNTKPN